MNNRKMNFSSFFTVKLINSLQYSVLLVSSAFVLFSCDNSDIVSTTEAATATTDLTTSGLAKTAISKTISYTSKTWMTALPDQLDIRQVSIPGSHDSGSKDLLALAKCQDMSITDQLNSGIRFLDLRLTPVGSGSIVNFSLMTSHTFVSTTNVKEVLKDVNLFLTNNPKEIVLIKIARDGGAKFSVPDANNKANAAFYTEYNLYKNSIKVENFLTQTLVAKAIDESGLGLKISTTAKIGLPMVVGDLRGKVVLFYDYSRFPATFKKINTIAQGVYEDNLNGVQQLPLVHPSLLIQDFYQNTWYSSSSTDVSTKKALIQDLMKKRLVLRTKDVSYTLKGVDITSFNQKMPFSFNYLSMSGVVTTPKEYAVNINRFFESDILGYYSINRFSYTIDKLKVNYRVGYGITMMDFPSANLIKGIYDDNFNGNLEDITLK
jgi:hypothetical protein